MAEEFVEVTFKFRRKISVEGDCETIKRTVEQSRVYYEKRIQALAHDRELELDAAYRLPKR